MIQKPQVQSTRGFRPQTHCGQHKRQDVALAVGCGSSARFRSSQKDYVAERNFNERCGFRRSLSARICFLSFGVVA